MGKADFPRGAKPPHKPLLFNASPALVLEEAAKIIADRKTLWDTITSEVRPEAATVENTLVPIVHGQNSFVARRRQISFYTSTSPSKDLRDAATSARELFTASDIELFTRDDMFQLVDSLLTKSEEGSISPPELAHYLKKLHRDFIFSGCALDDATKKEFSQGEKQRDEIARQFILNLDEGKAGLWLSAEELDGVPSDFIDKLKDGEGEHAGLLWVPLNKPSLAKVLAYAKREETRRKAYVANQNKVPQNIALHRNLVLIRDKLARFLGYSSHMASVTSDRMVGNPETVTAMVEQMRPHLVEEGKKEVEGLLRLKNEDNVQAAEGKGQTALYLWDSSYYERIRDERGASVNFNLVSEYFEVWGTLQRLMAIYEHIFDIKFEPITPERAQEILGEDSGYLTWHDDVKSFLLWDMKDKSFLGYIYFDLHPREGKYSHAGHFGLQPGFTRPDGSRSYPSAALVLNYPHPTPTKPSLLSLDQTRSFFHELGHGLHNLLSVTQTARFHGTAVDKDFVEAPSMMFEYFFWTARHIQGVSRHYTYQSAAYAESWKAANPGRELPTEQLSDETTAGLVGLKQSNKPLSLLRQLHFVIYDMAVHNPASRAELEGAKLAEIFNKTRTELLGLHGGEALGDGWDWGQGQSVLRLINGGSYAGCYYAYIMGRIWALDIFASTFEEDTMSKEAGNRYRQGVLRVGGMQPAMKTLTDFLGRDPKPDAYYKWAEMPQS